jgi:DNA-directed RNA polymerase subunit K/omega
MSEDKKNASLEAPDNKYMSVLAASKRARQLLDRAEKHNLTVDTEKVVLQALNEFMIGKVTYTNSPVEPKKKKKDEE